ncbi:hypothetical protein OIU78_012117 [Salix suchowensis]|nr:hypothetical protein OIU78_012117 [Salix suchowensis]
MNPKVQEEILLSWGNPHQVLAARAAKNPSARQQNVNVGLLEEAVGRVVGVQHLSAPIEKSQARRMTSQQSEVAQKLHVSETGKDVIMSQSTDLNNDLQPPRKPLGEIGNVQMNPSPIKHVQKTRKQKSALQFDTTAQSCSLPENAEGPRKMDKVSLADIPLKLTRGAKRSAAS